MKPCNNSNSHIDTDWRENVTPELQEEARRVLDNAALMAEAVGWLFAQIQAGKDFGPPT